MAFAVLLLAAATGLMLYLGFAERRRTAEILSALGASASEVGGFLWSEALLILVPGAIAGALIGVVAAKMLVKLLSGIFDPPPRRPVLSRTRAGRLRRRRRSFHDRRVQVARMRLRRDAVA